MAETVLFKKSVLKTIAKFIPLKLTAFLNTNCQHVKKINYDDCAVFIDVGSLSEFEIRLKSGSKEPETIKWIKDFMKKGEIFYDIGANIGAYSLFVSRFFNNSVKIYAFEPSFSNFAKFIKNITLNRAEDSINAFQVALSDSTKLDIFNYSSVDSGTALHSLGNALDDFGNSFKPVFKQKLLAYRMDDFIRQFNLPLPNHIKIDVDGTEFDILKGADGVLSDSSVKSLLLELNPVSKDTATSYLEQKGFRLREKAAKGHNYIFFR